MYLTTLKSLLSHTAATARQDSFKNIHGQCIRLKLHPWCRIHATVQLRWARVAILTSAGKSYSTSNLHTAIIFIGNDEVNVNKLDKTPTSFV